MYSTIQHCFWVETALALLIIVRYGYIASTGCDSTRKEKAYFTASIAFSLWLCVSASLMIFYDRTLPTFQLEGNIVSLHVRDSDNRHYSADLQIHTTLGGDVSVHSSDRSSALSVGRHVKVRYRGDTGELIKTYLYTADGKPDGVLNSTLTMRYYLGLTVGLFLIWASIRKFRRDPEGAEA